MTSSPKEDLQKLIELRQRHLQKLKEQQAMLGLTAPASLLLQIEDIETEIEALQEDLAGFNAPTETEHTEAPLVYIHNWGKKPATWPDTPHRLDWSRPGQFEQQPNGARSVPPPAAWRDDLLPQMAALPAETGASDWIRLAGNCALSTGFAFGTMFRAKDRHQIEVAQYIPGTGIEYWTSNAPVPKQIDPPSFTPLPAVGTPNQSGQASTTNDGVIVVAAITGKSVAGILRNVGAYFGEAEAFAQITTGETDFQTVKGVLVLEAETATRQKNNLAGWEVNALAQSSAYLVSDFADQIKAERLHLFMAAPLSLAVFMGHYWNHVHKTVQCYEETRSDRYYAPSCAVAVK